MVIFTDARQLFMPSRALRWDFKWIRPKLYFTFLYDVPVRSVNDQAAIHRKLAIRAGFLFENVATTSLALY